jgi:hypothetical protein
MQGRRAPRPPFGWEPNEMPRPSWRKQKEGRIALDSAADGPPPALKFLRSARAQWALRASDAPADSEPDPPRKTHRRPPQPVDATATQRQRLHRERARSGRRIVPVAINGDVEELLRASGVLQEWDTDSREAVGYAVERLLELLVLADGHA